MQCYIINKWGNNIVSEIGHKLSKEIKLCCQSEGEKMAKKIVSIGMLVMVFGLMVVGCDNLTSNSGYTFEFRVANPYLGGWTKGTITKIEFINGANKGDQVLETDEVNIAEQEMSKIYKVSGFTDKYEDDYHIFGIKLTFDDGETMFNWSSAVNGAKIKATILALTGLNFSIGDW
jgi:hypothetical protein